MNRKTSKMEYLLDRILGLKKHERITEDATAEILKEAVQISYRRGGEEKQSESNCEQTDRKSKTAWSEVPERHQCAR